MNGEEINAIRRWIERLESVARWVVGSLQLLGGVQVVRNGVAYDGGVFVPLTTPLTSTSWDGDAYSTTAKTLIDLSAVFGAPANIKAVALYVACRDSGSASSDTLVVLSPNNTSGSGVAFSPMTVNDRPYRGFVVVPCNSDGDIYYQIIASGASTMDVWIQIWGYWL